MLNQIAKFAELISGQYSHFIPPEHRGVYLTPGGRLHLQS